MTGYASEAGDAAKADEGASSSDDDSAVAVAVQDERCRRCTMANESGDGERREDQAACEADESTDTDTTDCTYDAAAAQDCLDELKAGDCDSFTSEDFGSSCENVYTCDADSEEDGEGEGEDASE